MKKNYLGRERLGEGGGGMVVYSCRYLEIEILTICIAWGGGGGTDGEGGYMYLLYKYLHTCYNKGREGSDRQT